MATDTVSVGFVINGVAVGATLTATFAGGSLGTPATLVVSGDPGLSIAQITNPALRMRVWVTETFGGSSVALYEINPPVIDYTPGALEVQVASGGGSVIIGSPGGSSTIRLVANIVLGTPSAYTWTDETGAVIGTGQVLTSTMSNGAHTLTVTATDALGNTFADTVSVVVGLSVPFRLDRIPGR